MPARPPGVHNLGIPMALQKVRDGSFLETSPATRDTMSWSSCRLGDGSSPLGCSSPPVLSLAPWVFSKCLCTIGTSHLAGPQHDPCLPHLRKWCHCPQAAPAQTQGSPLICCTSEPGALPSAHPAPSWPWLSHPHPGAGTSPLLPGRLLVWLPVSLSPYNSPSMNQLGQSLQSAYQSMLLPSGFQLDLNKTQLLTMASRILYFLVSSPQLQLS